MAASKLEMHVSPLTYQISTKFQRLYLCFREQASRWDPREYYATKPEVDKTNMAASELHIHVSPLPNEISTKLQRLYLCFRGPAIDWDQRKYDAIKSEVDKTNMAVSKLEMHVSPQPDKISTEFQRLNLCFR